MTPTPGTDFDAALGAVMGDLARDVDALHASLTDERTALDQANMPALEVAGRAKAQLLDHIEKLDGERRQLSDAAGIDSLSDARWSPTIELLLECRRLNEVNGRIVAQRMGHVRQALALLAGDAPGGSTYGPNGATKVRLRSGMLAQA
jgi:flagella synthesis protein FlgN